MRQARYASAFPALISNGGHQPGYLIGVAQETIPRYRDVPEAELPRTESLSDTVARIMPYWKCEILPRRLLPWATTRMASWCASAGRISHFQ